MRSINIPELSANDVFQTCISSIGDHALRSRMEAISYYIINEANDYRSKGSSKQLFEIMPYDDANPIVDLNGVTKRELFNLYGNQMVPKSKPARKYYDQLKQLAPYSRCPFCGLGQVATLDHFLPKSLYPQFSVTPINLVPSCRDCNSIKITNSAAHPEDQCLHPYFDHQHFVDEKWLFAEIIEGDPAVVTYSVNAPENWDDISKARVETHFKEFNLAERYAIEATSELANINDTLNPLANSLGKRGIQALLSAQLNAEKHKNSWKAALYYALVESKWYCEEGFRS